MKAHDILQKAAELVAGDRERTHGPKLENHKNIAALWNAYLAIRKPKHDEEGYAGERPLDAFDVAIFMALLKIARTQLGEHNPDDYLDGSAYLAIAGEIADALRGDNP